jgi:MFS family permease
MAGSDPASPRAGTFAALGHRNYRLWFVGQMVSLFGTWMQSTAQGYLVFQLTQSAAYLGYVGFAAGIPVWLFTLLGGVLADRLPRRRLLIITQSYMLLLALLLAALAFTGWVRPWHIVVLAFLLGAGNAFDAPARQAFVLELVDRRTLGNAIALNSAMFNTAIAIGPAVGGLAYAAFGPGWCFTLNALSFLAVIGALALMRLAPHRTLVRGGSTMGELRAGIVYVAHHPQILLLLSIVAVTSLFGMTFVTLMPAWAVRILHGDARTNGLLLSARGVGALASALFLASAAGNPARGKALAVGLAAFPTVLLAFAFLRQLGPALVLLVGVGAASILIYNTANALVQTLADDPLRGRVMGLYSLCVLGLMPVGALLAGSVAERIGEPGTLILSSGVMLVCSLAVWIRFPDLRRLV